MTEPLSLQTAGDATSTMQRLAELVEHGLRSDADVSWFVGPNGFLRCCQLEALGAPFPIADETLEDFLTEIDDRLTVVAGSVVSQRAIAVRATAKANDPEAVEVAGVLLAASLFDGGARADLGPLADLFVSDVRRLFAPRLGGSSREGHRSATAASLSVPIVVSTHARGDLVRLEIRPGSGPPGVAPDFEEAPFQRYDGEFLAAMADAHVAAVGGRGSWRFSVHSARTGLPLDAVMGRSGGLGAAVGLSLLEVSERQRRALDPRWIFTGDVRPDGTVEALMDRSGTSTYRNKLRAAQNKTVVLPSADVPTVSSLVAETDCELLGVDTVGHALDLVDRHRRGSNAYQRLMMESDRPGRWRRIVLPLFILAVAGSAAAWMLWPADGAQASIRRDNPALAVEPMAGSGLSPSTRLLFTRTETTNSAYRVCIAHMVCPLPIGRQARPFDRPGNDRYPVTGITPSDAEVFCHWAYGEGWGLPTFDQMRAAVAVNYKQFPFGDLGNPALVDPPQGLPQGELATVDDPALDGQELAWITGNASEWTRTQCLDGGCADVQAVSGSVVQKFRVFGISYLDSDREMPADWLNSEYLPESIITPDRGAEWIGFRCAREEQKDGD